MNFEALFSPGLCPEVNGMEEIDYTRLSGDWFLQRTDEPSLPDMLPSCHHCNIEVDSEGNFTGNEEVRIEGKTFIAEGIKGRFLEQIMEAELFN